MAGAEKVRLPLPRRAPAQGEQRIEVDRRVRRADLQQHVWRFPLGGTEIGIPIEPGEACDVVVACRIEHPHRPAQRRSCQRDGSDRVAAVVLAVAPGAHAVLPCFAPVDRTQRHQRCRTLEGCPAVVPERRPLLQYVLAAEVVIGSRRDPGQRRRDQVALGRMQVAAGRIATQRPARTAEFLPRGKRQRQFEQDAEVHMIKRHRRRQTAATQVVVARHQPIGGERQRQLRRAGVAAPRVGLVRPVEATRPRRVAFGPVLAVLVVGTDRHRGAPGGNRTIFIINLVAENRARVATMRIRCHPDVLVARYIAARRRMHASCNPQPDSRRWQQP